MDGQDCECPQNVDEYIYIFFNFSFSFLLMSYKSTTHRNVETKMII